MLRGVPLFVQNYSPISLNVHGRKTGSMCSVVLVHATASVAFEVELEATSNFTLQDI